MAVRTKLWIENVLFLKLYLREQLEIHQLKKALSPPYDITAYIINLPILWILYLIPYIILLQLLLPSYDSVTRYTLYSCSLVVRGRKGPKTFPFLYEIFRKVYSLPIDLFRHCFISYQPERPKLSHCNLHLILNVTQEWRVMLQTVITVEGQILSGIVLRYETFSILENYGKCVLQNSRSSMQAMHVNDHNLTMVIQYMYRETYMKLCM